MICLYVSWMYHPTIYKSRNCCLFVLEGQNTVQPLPGCDPTVYCEEKTPKENFLLCAAAVKKAIPGAKYGLGLMYHTGSGTEKSDERAAEMWKDAAKEGDLRAVFALGLLYETGSGVPEDMQKAMDLYLEAAHSGLVQAKRKVGMMYEEGIGFDVSYADALRWFREAADEGDCMSLFEIGWMSYFGYGCERSEKEAERLIRKSIDDGALMMLEKQAKIGNAYSQLRLGLLYEMGWGVEQSVFKALVWYTGAKIMGLKKADKMVRKMESQLCINTE